MAEQTHRIVSGEDSDIHDEPHIAGSRITVRLVHERVEEDGTQPDTLADRHDLDLADAYHALAYYHDNPGEMRAMERRRDDVIESAREQAIIGPDDL
jgi:uncharacterized protein (DUF433 family)